MRNRRRRQLKLRESVWLIASRVAHSLGCPVMAMMKTSTKDVTTMTSNMRATKWRRHLLDELRTYNCVLTYEKIRSLREDSIHWISGRMYKLLLVADSRRFNLPVLVRLRADRPNRGPNCGGPNTWAGSTILSNGRRMGPTIVAVPLPASQPTRHSLYPAPLGAVRSGHATDRRRPVAVDLQEPVAVGLQTAVDVPVHLELAVEL